MTAKTRPRLGSATGQGLVEYALILALVAVLAIGGLTLLGGQIKGVLNGVGVNVGGGAAVPTQAPTFYGNEDACEAAGFQWINPPGDGNSNAYCNNQPRPPATIDDDDDCRDAGYYWIERSWPQSDYCSATPAPPSSYNDDDDCRDAGYYWIDPPGQGSSNAYCSATPTPAATPTPTPAPTPTPDPYPRQVGGPCDANGGVWDYNGGNNWECDHPTPRGTPPPPSPAGQAGDWCNPTGFFDNNGSWVWRTEWDGDGAGHWDTSWFCDGSLRPG